MTLSVEATKERERIGLPNRLVAINKFAFLPASLQTLAPPFKETATTQKPLRFNENAIYLQKPRAQTAQPTRKMPANFT